MAVLFCVRPATRNIGNDVINRAVVDVLRAAFGSDAAVVNVPALGGRDGGGLTAASVYDMNRLADGVIVGGGNLFENGQLTVDTAALAALRVPMMMLGVSHGRIRAESGELVARTDSMAPQTILPLTRHASHVLVRDHGSARMLRELGVEGAEVAGCPTLFLPPNEAGRRRTERVLVSIRHPARMSVAPELQWRVARDVDELLVSLRRTYGDCVSLVCHDYQDLEFARAFPGVPLLYFDDVDRYLDALRDCRLSVSYRLHAFLPCLAFGTPAIHLSYDERGAEMVATAGMRDWDVDITRERDVAAAVMHRVAALARYDELRAHALGRIARFRAKTTLRVGEFARRVAAAPEEQAV